MSIDRLRYFSAVVETRNLRRAAELVGIAPPSMSKAISVLESELGHKLIHPEGRGIGITPKGLEVYRLSISLLEENRRFYQRLKTGEAATNRIRVATFEVFSTYFISSFLEAEKMNDDVLLLETTPGKIEQSILDGLVDVGITYLPAPDSDLEYKEIGSFQMGVFGHKSWEKKPFSDWAFAVPTTELKLHSSKAESLDLWPSFAPKRTIKYQFELLETALQTSRYGLSVIHCPRFIAKLQNEFVKPDFQLHSLSPPSGYTTPKPTKTYLVGRKGAVGEVLERKMAKFMRSLEKSP